MTSTDGASIDGASRGTSARNGKGVEPAHGVRPASRWHAVAVMAALLLTACSGEQAPGDASAVESAAGSSAASSAEPRDEEPSGTPTAAPMDRAGGGAPVAGAGCAPGGDPAPGGARTASIVDIDGDGATDEAWFTDDVDDRRFGITTASGASFSTPIASASPIAASGVVGVVTAGTATSTTVPIALIDTGRSVALYSLAGCTIAQTVDASGEPYTFDKGFTGYGTGVGCPDIDGALRLAGLDARGDGERFRIDRTIIELSADGREASNGGTETVADVVLGDSDLVRIARSTTCGTATAGDGGLAETPR